MRLHVVYRIVVYSVHESQTPWGCMQLRSTIAHCAHADVAIHRRRAAICLPSPLRVSCFSFVWVPHQSTSAPCFGLSHHKTLAVRSPHLVKAHLVKAAQAGRQVLPEGQCTCDRSRTSLTLAFGRSHDQSSSRARSFCVITNFLLSPDADLKTIGVQNRLQTDRRSRRIPSPVGLGVASLCILRAKLCSKSNRSNVILTDVRVSNVCPLISNVLSSKSKSG
jgi:hypothetical protein